MKRFYSQFEIDQLWQRLLTATAQRPNPDVTFRWSQWLWRQTVQPFTL